MSHPDGESLALVALGELADDTELQRHLERCELCRFELDSLRRTVKLCREVTAEDLPTPPPDRVWQSIAAELALSSKPDVPDELAERRRTRAARRGWSRAPMLAVAAAAVLGVVAGGVLTSVVTTGGDDSVTVSVVANASLEPLPGKPYVGVAQLGESDTGRVLSISVDGPPPENGYYEVWLLTPTVTDMISVGALDRTNHGLFLLPDGVDLTEYSVVDISLEPFNGDPTHSSDSLVRGEIQV
jgi:anti-sigma-K factor RskA